MDRLIKTLHKGFFIIGALYCSSVLALGSGDWTQKFILKNGGFILHTPHEININNSFSVGNMINLNGLVLGVGMTRREFIFRLIYAGFIDIDEHAYAID